MHRTVLHFLDDINKAAGKIKKYTTPGIGVMVTLSF
jgi:hypothetical protein